MRKENCPFVLKTLNVGALLAQSSSSSKKDSVCPYVCAYCVILLSNILYKLKGIQNMSMGPGGVK